MTVPLISQGRPLSASDWNVLFQELDAKFTYLLNGFSPLMAGFSFPMGKCFWFNDGSPLRNVHVAYTHTPFATAAADPLLGVQLIDATKKVIAFTEQIPDSYHDLIGLPHGANYAFFRESLEVHKRNYDQGGGAGSEPHWIMELGHHRMERYCSFGLAELICENITTLSFLSNWDKYRFFRIHNLTGSTLTVTFQAGSHIVAVPAYSVKCVRRAAAGSGYLDGYNYFHQYLATDLTLLTMPSADSPWGSMGGNTVCNPALVYSLIAVYAANASLIGDPHANPAFHVDPHELCDIGAEYASLYA